MDNDNPVIYGLEFQARALSAQTAETEVVRFLIGTQSLKFSNNQVHLVELNEENSNGPKTQVYRHPVGEIWALEASPTDPFKFITVYNTLNAEGTCEMRGALWKLPTPDQRTEELKKLADIDTSAHGVDLKVITYNPTEESRLVSVVDDRFVIWNIGSGEKAQEVGVGVLSSKGQPRFTNAKWNPHTGSHQLVTLDDTNVRGWDLRDVSRERWLIPSAHSQIIRDLDFNANRQYLISTCGDDGYMKFWDIRSSAKPVYSRIEHSHWVWSIRINRFHDQLVLTSSSDSRVILSSIASISSEPFAHAAVIPEDETTVDLSLGHRQHDVLVGEKLEDGVVGRYEEHEDSVYAVEWSSADPWTFASLSYDGRLVLNKVPRKYKYKILL